MRLGDKQEKIDGKVFNENKQSKNLKGIYEAIIIVYFAIYYFGASLFVNTIIFQSVFRYFFYINND